MTLRTRLADHATQVRHTGRVHRKVTDARVLLVDQAPGAAEEQR